MITVQNNAELQTFLQKGGPPVAHLVGVLSFEVDEKRLEEVLGDVLDQCKNEKPAYTEAQYRARAIYRMVAMNSPVPAGAVPVQIAPEIASVPLPAPTPSVQSTPIPPPAAETPVRKYVVHEPQSAMTFDRWVIVGLLATNILEAIYALARR